MTNLAGYIRSQFSMMVNHSKLYIGLERTAHRGPAYFQRRVLSAEIAGNQEVWRLRDLRAHKLRPSAGALVRSSGTSICRPIGRWGLDPGPDPAIPDNIMKSIEQLIRVEVSTLQQSQQPVDPDALRDRLNMLLTGARQAAKKKAAAQAKIAEDKIDEYLVEGGFYKALAEFLADLPIFPFCLH